MREGTLSRYTACLHSTPRCSWCADTISPAPSATSTDRPAKRAGR
ncbi:MAG: hypothetical protein GF331_00845 [Chitinivibrionales bacterium]|nr:hypothetical protein [Chitinivibrionales bacterium]